MNFCILALICFFGIVAGFPSIYWADRLAVETVETNVLCECIHPGSTKDQENTYICTHDKYNGGCGDGEACISPQGRKWHVHETPCLPKPLTSKLEGYGLFDGVSLKSACARTYALADRANVHLCAEYEDLQLITPDCRSKPETVPRILHMVGKVALTYATTTIALSNPAYRLNALSDKAAGEYVLNRCGSVAAKAYNCLNAAAFRGDLFRYCALYAEGGIYLDQDILPLKPLDEMFSRCSSATLGHDFPMNGRHAKQTKMMAAAPKTKLMQCALNTVISNVQNRAYPESPLEISATLAMQSCYEKYPEDVAITYIDTRVAVWPYTGMRAGNDVIAYELAAPGSKHFVHDPMDYPELTARREVYSDKCPL